MNIKVLGGGVSSSIFAYEVKKNHPLYNVEVLECSDKLLKRVLVSGNGRANFFNQAFIKNNAFSFFNHPEEFKRLIDSSLSSEFLMILNKEMGFNYYSDETGRMYPFANLSSSLKDSLETALKRIGVKISLLTGADKIDPSQNKIILWNDKSLSYDYLFMGIGGFSFDRINYTNLGLLKDLNIEYIMPSSCLCPLYVSNFIPTYLEGTRLKGQLSLLKDGKTIYKEDGELLFKKKSISGICIFDASMYIDDKSKYQVLFNPFVHDGIKIETLSDNLEGTLPYPLCRYIEESKKDSTIKSILELLTFNIKGKYSLKESQISLGGISTSEINSDFSLKKHPNILVGGEIIDLHAICGGFNMGCAFLSGLKASKTIK